MIPSEPILVLAAAERPLPENLLSALAEAGRVHHRCPLSEAAEVLEARSFAAAVLCLDRIDAGVIARAIQLRASCGLDFRFVAWLAADCGTPDGPHPFDAVLPHDAAPDALATAIDPFPPAVCRPAALRTRVYASGDSQPLTLPDGLILCGTQEAPQAALLSGPFARQALRDSLGVVEAAAIPTVGVGGDVPASDFALSDLRDGVPDSLRALSARFDLVRESIRRSEDARVALLARMAVRDRRCEPVLDPRTRGLAIYADEAFVAPLVPKAEALVRAGLAERIFFEKLHVCPSCASSRLHVREECGACGSGDVHESAVVHHFRCGHQAPEEDFRRGDDLVCPRCVRPLEHFGFDYDRPGSLAVCRSCGHTTGEAAVGFMCLDCSARHPADRVETRTLYAYAATDLGRRMVLSSSAEIDLAQSDEEADNFRAVLDDLRRSGRHPTLLTIVIETGPSQRERVRLEKHLSRAARELFAPPNIVLPWRGGLVVVLPDTDLGTVVDSIPAVRAGLTNCLVACPNLTIAAHDLDGLRSASREAA